MPTRGGRLGARMQRAGAQPEESNQSIPARGSCWGPRQVAAPRTSELDLVQAPSRCVNHCCRNIGNDKKQQGKCDCGVAERDWSGAAARHSRKPAAARGIARIRRSKRREISQAAPAGEFGGKAETRLPRTTRRFLRCIRNARRRSGGRSALRARGSRGISISAGSTKLARAIAI